MGLSALLSGTATKVSETVVKAATTVRVKALRAARDPWTVNTPPPAPWRGRGGWLHGDRRTEARNAANQTAIDWIDSVKRERRGGGGWLQR